MGLLDSAKREPLQLGLRSLTKIINELYNLIYARNRPKSLLVGIPNDDESRNERIRMR